MKRILVLAVLFFPLVLNAQSKLSPAIASEFSAKAAERFQLRNDPAMVFVTEQLSRSGSGGLEVDKTMMDLQKDPAALDEALKFLYQYSDCNRQQFIANLRAMNLPTNSVFPLATYVVNKYKGEAKALQEEKAALLRSGMIPTTTAQAAPAAPAPNTAPAAEGADTQAAAAAAPAAAATTEAANTATTTASPAQPAAPKPAETPAQPADTRNWEVRNIFSMNTPEQLMEAYGKENVAQRNATDFQGNDLGPAYYVYPDTDNEMEVIFHSDQTKTITFAHENAKWKSPFGIRVGDPLEKVVKVNGRDFRINGFEWENGGLVASWEGGALEGKGVSIIFKAVNTGDPKLYDQVTGGKKFRTDLGALKKLGVVVEKVAFKTYQ